MSWFTNRTEAERLAAAQNALRRWSSQLPMGVLLTMSLCVAALCTLLAFLAVPTPPAAPPAAPGTPPPKPAPPAAPTASPKPLVLQSETLFAFGASVLTDDVAIRRQLTDCIRSPGVKHVTVTGFTDCLGSAAYNARLSQQRANAVKAFLQAASREVAVDAIGKGSGDARHACATGQEPTAAFVASIADDRRVVVVCA